MRTPANAPSPNERLQKFLESKGLGPTEAGRQLGVSHVAVISWTKEGKTPSFPLRLAIERWTSGEVPAASWETEEERAIVERVKPYAPTPSDAQGAA